MKTITKKKNTKTTYPDYYPDWLIAMLEDQFYCELFW